MKTKIAESIIFLVAAPASSEAAANGPHSYLIGGIIAFLIMGYLIYSLLRPEKF
jgi:K+-transporting ATPase KdpF subunit